MRTTLILDGDLIERAREASGITEKAALVKEGLRALIVRESARRLAALGGSEPDLEPFPGAVRRASDPGRYFGMDQSPAAKQPRSDFVP